MTSSIQKLAEFSRPTPLGDFNVVSYNRGGNFAFALTRGKIPTDSLMVRVQSACLFGESFMVNSCDCGQQLTLALNRAATEPSFLIVYMMDQEGRGLGMFQKIKAIEAEVKHDLDMVEAFNLLGLPLDLREYGAAAEIIRDINGDRPIRLLTNNPKKVDGLTKAGIKIQERLPHLIEPTPALQRYLSSKKHKMGHILPNVK